MYFVSLCWSWSVLRIPLVFSSFSTYFRYGLWPSVHTPESLDREVFRLPLESAESCLHGKCFTYFFHSRYHETEVKWGKISKNPAFFGKIFSLKWYLSSPPGWQQPAAAAGREPLRGGGGGGVGGVVGVARGACRGNVLAHLELNNLRKKICYFFKQNERKCRWEYCPHKKIGVE